MPSPITDPYQILGVSPGASDAEVRAAYRRLVQLHHPDHNGGSAESARRFEEVQAAYARVRELRASAPSASSRATGSGQGSRSSGSRPRPAEPPPRVNVDPNLESRLQDLERELREAHEAGERARREAHEASERARRDAREAVAQGTGRASDEELGYVTTDDSFSKILADAGSQIADRLAQAGDRIAEASDQAREHPVSKRVADLIDELERLSSKLTGDSKGSPE